MLKFLRRSLAAHPWAVCIGWLVAALGLTLLAPSWDSRTADDDIRFLPARCPSVRGYHLLRQAFPQDVFASRAILAVERPDRPLADADLDLVDRCIGSIERLQREEPDLKIGRIYSHRDPFIGGRLVSEDRQCVLIQVALPTPYLALQTRKTVDRLEAAVRPLFDEAGPGAPRLLVTGPAGVGRDLLCASARSLDFTTLATVLLVLVVLLLVYRSPLLALVPLVTIGVSCWVALEVLALFTLIPGVYLVNVSRVFAVVLLFGAGTDYCIFLISRYREELGAGHRMGEALGLAVGGVGGALAASAGTVICGLGLMGFAEFAKVRCAGPAIALSLAVVLAASLTLTPALLRLLGPRVFWPWPPPSPKKQGQAKEALWERISYLVEDRPLLVWGVGVAVLLPLAVLGLTVTPNYRPTGELSASSGSVQGVAAIQRHFTAGEIGPVTVLLASPADWDSVQGRRVIAHLSRGFARLDNVAEVRSLTQPLGSPMEETPGYDPPGAHPSPKGPFGALFHTVCRGLVQIREEINHTVREFYLGTIPRSAVSGPDEARFVTRLDVVLRSDPFAPQSQATLDLIQTWLRERLPGNAESLGAVRAECYGVTVNARDLAEVTEGDRGRVNVLVLAGVFVILLALVRRPGMAAYLLLTVVFSYLATLGATTLLGTLWSGRPLGQVDWRVPFFLFTILVAVGEDYNILLITRALKERKRHGGEEGMRRALAQTGGAITSCGLIMAGTFATLMFGGLGTLIQIGFALAFGVLLDTFVVRPFLVPTFAMLVWRQQAEHGWPEWDVQRWLPRIRRWLPRIQQQLPRIRQWLPKSWRKAG
jgi:RND superfamily putative drug exporter